MKVNIKILENVSLTWSGAWLQSSSSRENLSLFMLPWTWTVASYESPRAETFWEIEDTKRWERVIGRVLGADSANALSRRKMNLISEINKNLSWKNIVLPYSQ